MDPPTPQIPSIYKAPLTELQPSRKSFLAATSAATDKAQKVEKEKDEENESHPDKISMGIFSQTVHAFAEAFTAHGVHYIFERGQNLASRIFWVIIVVIAFLCSCLMLESAWRAWIDNPILTSVKSTGLNIKDIEHPAIIICGQGSNFKTPFAAMYQLALDFSNVTNVSGAKLTEIDENDAEFDDFMENILTPYLDQYFPLKNDQAFHLLGFGILQMIRLIASKNPEARIRAQVARAGGYDPCAAAATNVNWLSNETESSTSPQVTYSCPPGYVKNAGGSYCYKSMGQQYPGYCAEKLDLESVTFQSDAEVDGFIQLIKRGNLSMEHNLFDLNAWRNEQNQFAFRGGFQSINTTFTKLKIIQDSEDFDCIGAFLPETPAPGDPEDILYLKTHDCSSVFTVCQKYNTENVVCNASQSKKRRKREEEIEDKKEGEDEVNFDEFYDSLDFMLNPALENKYERGYNLLSKAYRDAFREYNKNPCFDVKNYTSIYKGQWSLLKQCKWKGRKLPCSAIFSTYPTDKGMCCAFNMRKAEEIFKSGKYVNLVQELQEKDKNTSFESSKEPRWFTEDDEPKASQGLYKGLTIMADLHTDGLSASSVDEDFHGFMAYVAPGNSFPLTTKRGFTLKAGYENRVVIRAVDIQTAVETRASVNPLARNCYFADEKPLDLHRNYSQTNCRLECALQYAQKELNTSCTPWYFPTEDKPGQQMCDPWSAFFMERTMFQDMPDGECDHCLPDCTETQFSTSVTSVPFRRCDYKNLGVSYLCDFNNPYLPEPRIWGRQVLVEYDEKGGVPRYISDQVKTSERQHTVKNSPDSVFNYMNYGREGDDYEAYERDISVIHFYFDSSTAFQYYREPRMTLTTFISQIGGVLGLFLGFSIVSLVELLYWFLYRLCYLLFNPKRKATKASHSRYKKRPFDLKY